MPGLTKEQETWMAGFLQGYATRHEKMDVEIQRLKTELTVTQQLIEQLSTRVDKHAHNLSAHQL